MARPDVDGCNAEEEKKTQKKRTVKPKRKAAQKPTSTLTKERPAEMIEEATVDAYNESEQAAGWLAMFEEHLELPFDTEVLGASVHVTRIDHRDDDRLVAICTRGREHQAIGLADLPLPRRMPPGAEWIEAYRRWIAGR